ncbi:MAG: hypothetical protein ACFFAH_13600 [Promethearchaeota archaeon]
MNWQKEKFYEFIIENNVFGFFKEPLKLKSGRLSYWYVNWRTVAEDVYLIDQLSDFLISFVKKMNLNPDCFYGVPEGATKLSIITQYKWAKNNSDYGQGVYPLSMGRGKHKDHGDQKDRYFLGFPKGKVIVLEDTITTGGAFIETIEKFLELGINVIAGIVLTNRNELRDDRKTVKEMISDKGIKFYSMSDAIELIPRVYNKLQPGEFVAKNIENYFKKYGIKEIKLL